MITGFALHGVAGLDKPIIKIPIGFIQHLTSGKTDMTVFGNAANLEQLNGDQADIGNLHSSMATILRVPSPNVFSPSLVGVQNEKIVSVMPVREFKEGEYIVTITAKGFIKKTLVH